MVRIILNANLADLQFKRRGPRAGCKLSKREAAAAIAKPVPPQERPCRWAGCQRGTRSVAGYCGRHVGRIGS